MIIIPLFTLGSIYSTYASGAEQMPKTNMNLTAGFCTLCFYFPSKMLHLNAPFFPLKCSVSPKKSLKCSDNAHYTNGFF